MQTIKYEHVFPLLKTCGISPLEHQASGILEDYSFLEYYLPLEISRPRDMIKVLCDITFSVLRNSLPLTILSFSPYRNV